VCANECVPPPNYCTYPRTSEPPRSPHSRHAQVYTHAHMLQGKEMEDTTLQHAATRCTTYCNTLATRCHMLQRTAACCNMLQQTATRCNKLQHTTTHYSTLQFTAAHCRTMSHTTENYHTLQHAVMQCNTPHYTATRCNTLQHAATRCNTRAREWVVMSACASCLSCSFA